ncbi:hypothetical protein HGM15179_007253 [Zosterops borbonicus]|uniref:Uncharacterized protein n=1 Tax=Zosterops borbonicus TaxID=364589 RepID=A0A8K1GJ20_9PASS|nr:hypothetical protein HGM15179_007253 [Zosterops borbonicus]
MGRTRGAAQGSFTWMRERLEKLEEEESGSEGEIQDLYYNPQRDLPVSGELLQLSPRTGKEGNLHTREELQEGTSKGQDGNGYLQ